jgi:hypothetical protein
VVVRSHATQIIGELAVQLVGAFAGGRGVGLGFESGEGGGRVALCSASARTLAAGSASRVVAAVIEAAISLGRASAAGVSWWSRGIAGEGGHRLDRTGRSGGPGRFGPGFVLLALSPGAAPEDASAAPGVPKTTVADTFTRFESAQVENVKKLVSEPI